MRRKTLVSTLVATLGAVGAAASVLTASADAQAFGFALDRYEPTPAGDVFFGSDFPLYNRYRLFTLGLTVDYARAPLVLRTADASNNITTRDLIDHMVVMHLSAGINLADRLQFNFSLPMSMFQTGPARGQIVSGLGAYNSPVAGDVRLGARVRIAGDSDASPISLHLGIQAFLGFIPYNGQDQNVTDESIRVRPYVTVAGHPSIVRYSVTAGYHWRPDRSSTPVTTPYFSPSTVQLNVSGEAFVQAALGFVADGNRLTIGPEGYVSFAPSLLAGNTQPSVSGEVQLGINYLVGNLVLVGAAAGPGFGAAGTPAVRGLFRIAYAPVATPAPPPPPDRDHDGLLDADDQCPDEPLGLHPDPLRRGCPARDTDADGVLDPDDQCPTVPQGERPDPTRAGCPDGDADNDGVLDHGDQCRDVAAGPHPDPERAGCPDGDADNDGVFDHADQCRDVPAGVQPDPARAGCPVPDRDHDTVPDNVDHCPDQAGAPSPDPARNGCPGQVQIENGQLRILTQVFFASNRDVILPRSFGVLLAVAEALRASPQIRRISIEGHTDDAGDDARNLDLSQRRANSVMRWLSEHGVEATRLEAHGFGETRPLVPIAGLRGGPLNAARGQNRRVAFHIVDPAPSAGAAATTPPAAPAAVPAPAPAPAPASGVLQQAP